jgi:hypothetical protein
MRKLHINNQEGRNTQVAFGTLKPGASPRLGFEGEPVEFRRYLAATAQCLHDIMATTHGDDYASALLKGDPEVDLENVGRCIGETQTVFLTSKKEVMYAAPYIEEVVFSPDGEEKERSEARDIPANVNDELPVSWTSNKLPRKEIVRRFAINRTLQVRHRDGLTFDYLFEMAQSLDSADEVVLIGAGPKGRDPLIFSTNATPYRAFLEGRVKGDAYQLLLHLSNMELKIPAE